MHDVLIGAPRDIAGRSARPLVLQRSDEDFIDATLDDLRSAAGRRGLSGFRAQANNAQGVLKLFQPIQRQFHVALIESWCDIPGEPRIDPARVESAGMLLRRVGASGGYEGWMRSKGRVRGWVPLARSGGDSADPGAGARLQRSLTGIADIDRQLSGFALENPDRALDEHVISLYLAPPDVCSDSAKTFFYGIVPTVSSELSEVDASFGAAAGVDFGPQSAAFNLHLVQALRGDAMALPFPGQAVSADWLAAPDAAEPTDSTLARFVLLLRQLASEFDAFGGAAEVADLRQRLQAIALPMVPRAEDTVPRTVRADDFLGRAASIILQQQAEAGELEMPASWPALSPGDASALKAALHRAMQARFATMKGKTGRFEEPDARYALRAFVRLKADGECGPRIVWTDYSDPFVIAAWYEGAGAPPVQIPLPDPSDRNLLKALKPNVAFVVPPALQSLLSGATKDILDGKGKSNGLGLTWICAFNIPIITICAFLVLNIFLSLFNIVFGWLFSMKICLPFPKVPPTP